MGGDKRLREDGSPFALTQAQWEQFRSICYRLSQVGIGRDKPDPKQIEDDILNIGALARMAGFKRHEPFHVAHELVVVLESVGKGIDTVTPSKDFLRDREPGQMLSGEYEFRLSSGWIVEVFFDAGSFDYIDSMTAPDGRMWCYDALPKQIINWSPNHIDARRAWGFE